MKLLKVFQKIIGEKVKKSTKIFIIALLFILSTGCTKSLKDGKEVVTNDKTGQTLTANILCKPSDKELLSKYNEHNENLTVKLEDLPTCKSFTPNKIKYISC